MKYFKMPRGSGKSEIIMDIIKNELKEGGEFIMLQDMSYSEINERLEKLKKERAKIDSKISSLECLKHSIAPDGFKGYYTYDKDLRNYENHITVRF